MSAIIYPLDFHRKFERRWAAGAQSQQRRSPPEGTDICICGHTVIAPSRATYTPGVVINHWQCARCGREWTTSAVSKS